MNSSEKGFAGSLLARFVLNGSRRLLFAIAVLILAPAASSIAWASPSVMAASSADKSVETAQRVSRVLGHLLEQANINFNGQIRLIKQPGFNAAAVFASPGYIQVEESYANALSDGELTFVVGHELAHLLGDHHQRLQHFYAEHLPLQTWIGEAHKPAGFSVADEIRLRHALELDADRIGVIWTQSAGFSAVDAATALERAYDGARQAFNTHPAVKERADALFLLSTP